MSKRKKLLERMRRNPQNVRFAEIDTLLLAFGFERRQRGPVTCGIQMANVN